MHGTGDGTKSVVVEQLPVVVAKYLLSAFAGAIDKLAMARPATKKSDGAFMAILSQFWNSKMPFRNLEYHISRDRKSVV